MFVIYEGNAGDVLITTPEKEPEMLEAYGFNTGMNDLDDYDRKVVKGPVARVRYNSIVD